MTDEMKEANTDVRLSFASMLDSVGELFSGRLSFNDILYMDVPMMRAMVKARLQNIERKTLNTDGFDKLIGAFAP